MLPSGGFTSELHDLAKPIPPFDTQSLTQPPKIQLLQVKK